MTADEYYMSMGTLFLEKLGSYIPFQDPLQVFYRLSPGISGITEQ
ncbi:hypothetical protein [Methanosarcina sp. 2.H.A.1B.4]|nr:hypothetical protein [Methanosarcina sp. 2.H.A.1B.4]